MHNTEYTPYTFTYTYYVIEQRVDTLDTEIVAYVSQCFSFSFSDIHLIFNLLRFFFGIIISFPYLLSVSICVYLLLTVVRSHT